jgi:hypothetical protein
VAHDVAVTHPIFKGPLAVMLEFEQQQKPLDYYLAPGTSAIGETMDVWKVQEKTFPEIDPGLVSSRENFSQTPDAEVISGGFNAKGPSSVAIGRHGNYFLWGFSAQPSDMTESARRVFVNAVCYIQQFDGKGAAPVNPSARPNRDSFLADLYFMRSTTDAYINKQVEKFQQMVQANPLSEDQVKQVGNDPAAFFRGMFGSRVTQIRAMARYSLSPEVRAECGDDPERLITYYRDNLEYLRTAGQGMFQVDDDAKKLGVSNRSPALLNGPWNY